MVSVMLTRIRMQYFRMPQLDTSSHLQLKIQLLKILFILKLKLRH